MKSLIEKSETDNMIMTLLGTSEIRHIIAHTNKGELSLMLPFKGTAEDYKFILDAVPLEAKDNKELIELFNGILFTL